MKKNSGPKLKKLTLAGVGLGEIADVGFGIYYYYEKDGKVIRDHRGKIKKFQILAHRVSWGLQNGAPTSRYLLHTCDDLSCVNPSHLILSKKNSKGRRRGPRCMKKDFGPKLKRQKVVGNGRAL